ncbi:MAG: GerMN domain-containing protein [Spirochaetales bacterium]|nr:GerMN domain-containing protein [Spirochaetales bacterium]
MNIRTRNLIIWSSILTASFLLSLVIFLARPDRTDRYILFFPSEVSDEWIGEARDIHHTPDREQSVLAVLKELTLGPMSLRLEPALPKGTGVRSVLLREKTLYIDFTAHLAVSYQTLDISFSEMLEGVRRSVFFNFPAVEELVIYVEGSHAGQYQKA